MNLVATYNFGNVPYACHTVPYMRAYAARCGADFIEYREFTEQHLFPPGAAWFKLEAIRKFASQDRYTTLLLLDADQLVMPTCPNLFSIAGEHIRAVVDMGIPDGGDFADWCEQVLYESPTEGPYFNAGMLLIPLEAARRIVPHLKGPYAPHPLQDQHFLNQRVRQHETIDWLPREFNWLAPQFREASMQQQIIHFVGQHKGLIEEYVRDLESCHSVSSGETLSQLGQRMGTDKGTDHSYLEVYEQLFDSLRRRPMSMLEIGVFRGASLRMWREWFPEARVYGMDVDPSVEPVPGCEIVIASATDRNVIEAKWSDESLDLIIDDGSHWPEHQFTSLCYLWPKLKKGGFYVIEDIAHISFLKYFEVFRPIVLNRRHRRSRGDDILVLLMK